MKKIILSFNGSKFFEGESPKQIALTLMSFSEGQFAIEAPAQTRAGINHFLKNHGLKNFKYLNPYESLHSSIALKDEKEEPPKTPSKITSNQYSSPASMTSSSPSMFSPSKYVDPTKIQKENFTTKTQDLFNKLTKEIKEAFHFLHLDQEDEYESGPIYCGNFSCYIAKDENDYSKLLKTAANEIGLKTYADSLLKTNGKSIINEKDGAQLLKNLAAIRYLLQTSYDYDKEKLKILVVAFHQTYDMFLTEAQRENLIFLEKPVLGKNFVKNSFLPKKQWAAQKLAKDMLDKLDATQNLHLTTLLNFTQYLFPFLSPNLKDQFVYRYVNEQLIDQTIKNAKKDTFTSKTAKNGIIIAAHTLAIEKDPQHKSLNDTVKKVLEDQITYQKNQVYYENIKANSIFTLIPIIGHVFIFLVSLFHKPSKENSYAPPKITQSKYLLLKTKFPPSPSTASKQNALR